MSKMLEETRQQPEALSNTLEDGAIRLRELRRHLEAKRPRLVILVARGTSDNAAQFGRYLIEITTHIPVSLAAPSVLTLYASPLDLRYVLMVGVSQSGGSADTNPVGANNGGERRHGRERGRDQNVYVPTPGAVPGAVCAGRRGVIRRAAPVAAVCGRRAGDRGPCGRDRRALHVHDAGGDRGPRLELRQCAGVRLEADGDVLRGDRAAFLGGPDARPDRAGGTRVSGLRVRTFGSHVAVYFRGGGHAGGREGRDAGDHRREQQRGLRQACAADPPSAPNRQLGWPAGFVHAHSVHRAGAIVRRAIGGDQGVEPGSAEDAAQDHPDDVGPAVSEPRP